MEATRLAAAMEMEERGSVEERLSREILRKFKLVSTARPGAAAGAAAPHVDGPPRVQATEAEGKEDREIVCEEIFNDVTGVLDENAQGGPHAPSSAAHSARIGTR